MTASAPSAATIFQSASVVTPEHDGGFDDQLATKITNNKNELRTLVPVSKVR
jgi:hypothetical protein